MYLAHGFDDYLTKPIEIEALESCLAVHLPKDKVTYIDEGAEGTEPPIPEAADDDSFTLAELVSLRGGLAGVDLLLGLSYCMDSKEFYLETLSAFADEDKSSQLEAAYAGKDYDTYRITAHSIKSSAKTIGASLLSERARVLEFAARDGDTALIDKEHSAFIKDYTTLIAGIRKVMIK
jgi:HPt (histidine-containing phosphotransfer) domain-containing protein